MPFSPSVSRPVVANKVAMVTVDRVRYSVPVTCARHDAARRELRGPRRDLPRLRAASPATRAATCAARSCSSWPTTSTPSRASRGRRSPAPRSQSADPVFMRARDLALRTPDGHRRFAEILLLGRELGLERLAAALREGLARGCAAERRSTCASWP